METTNKMRLYFCAIVTLLEMLDTSYINAIGGRLMDVFKISYAHIANLYISLAIGAAISVPLTKYCYQHLNLAILYRAILLVLLADFSWAFATSSWSVFCFLRLIQGFFLTLLYSLSFLDVVINSSDRDKELNLINGISIVGLISGPVLSGYITLIGWNYIFILFNLLVLTLIWLLNKIEFQATVIEIRKICRLEITEYLCFVIVVSLGCMLIDAQISVLFIFPFIFACSILLTKYYRYEHNFIFNKAIFNRNLLNTVIIHLLCRFSVIAFTPLLASILYQCYHYSVIKISVLLTVTAIGSLLAKILYAKNIFNPQQSTLIFFVYMGFLSLFAGSPFASMPLLCLLLMLFGVFSSVIFNYINSCIFYKQREEYTEDLSVILTMLQMLFYGLCSTLIFRFFSYLEMIYTVETSLAIIILFMVYCTSIAFYLHQKLLADAEYLK